MITSNLISNEDVVRIIKNGGNYDENITFLYNKNKGFIHSLILHMGIQGTEDIQDAEQNAFIGLAEAVKHFEACKGKKFLTFASYYICKEIRAGHRQINSINCMSFPSYVTGEFFRIKKAETELLYTLSTEPQEADLAKACNMSVEKIRSLKHVFEPCKSIYASVKSDTNGELLLIDCIEDKTDIETSYEEKESINIIQKAISKLPLLEKNIIIELFYNDMSPQDIADKYKKSRQTVHNKINRALCILRKETLQKLT